MKRRSTAAPAPDLATGGRLYWCCDGTRHNRLHERARRIAAARDLDELDDQLRALENAWVQVQVSDEDRLALLELIGRRRQQLDQKRTPARAGAGSRYSTTASVRP